MTNTAKVIYSEAGNSDCEEFDTTAEAIMWLTKAKAVADANMCKNAIYYLNGGVVKP